MSVTADDDDDDFSPALEGSGPQASLVDSISCVGGKSGANSLKGKGSVTHISIS